MSATITVHPAKAAMDVWRVTTPRPIMDVVRTVKNRDKNGNTIFIAHCGLVRVSEQTDYTLTTNENHLAAVLEALSRSNPRAAYQLVSFTIVDEKYGCFVMEQLP
jgi:hypothetical protein